MARWQMARWQKREMSECKCTTSAKESEQWSTTRLSLAIASRWPLAAGRCRCRCRWRRQLAQVDSLLARIAILHLRRLMLMLTLMLMRAHTPLSLSVPVSLVNARHSVRFRAPGRYYWIPKRRLPGFHLPPNQYQSAKHLHHHHHHHHHHRLPRPRQSRDINTAPYQSPKIKDDT